MCACVSVCVEGVEERGWRGGKGVEGRGWRGGGGGEGVEGRGWRGGDGGEGVVTASIRSSYLILFHGFRSGIVDFDSHSFWMCQLIKLVRGREGGREGGRRKGGRGEERKGGREGEEERRDKNDGALQDI